jgi:four helix bundle protein
MEFVLEIYKLSEMFPRSEEFGLKSQLRRASVSVPSCIAEGLTRKTKADKLHFLNVVQGTLSEIDTQLEIAHCLQYISSDTLVKTENQLIQIQELLGGLIRSIVKSKA